MTEQTESIFVTPDDLAWLEANGVTALDRCPDEVAETLRAVVFQPALDQAEVDNDMDRRVVAPAPGTDALALVGGVLDHDEQDVPGGNLEELLGEAIAKEPGPFYIVPAIQGAVGCYRVDRFSYEVFSHIYSGNMILPMALIAPRADWGLIWDADLEYSLVARLKGSPALPDVFARKAELAEAFETGYPKWVPPGYRHMYVIDTYLRPWLSSDTA